MGSSKCQSGVLASVLDVDQFSRVRRAVKESENRRVYIIVNSLHSGDSFHNKIFACDGTRLVETADVNSTCKGDPERLRAEDGCPRRQVLIAIKSGLRDVPYFCKATREALTANDSSMGSSGGTTDVMIRMQSSRSLPLAIPRSSPVRSVSGLALALKATPTLDPDVCTGSDGEDEQETDEEESLHGIGRDSLCREDHCSDKLTLGGTEAGLEDNSKASAIGGYCVVKTPSEGNAV
jgi:hypothetical protein